MRMWSATFSLNRHKLASLYYILAFAFILATSLPAFVEQSTRWLVGKEKAMVFSWTDTNCTNHWSTPLVFLLAQGPRLEGAVNGNSLFNTTFRSTSDNGFVAIGTDTYGLADFDNFKITTAAEGAHIMKNMKKLNSDTLYFKPERHWQTKLKRPVMCAFSQVPFTADHVGWFDSCKNIVTRSCATFQ